MSAVRDIASNHRGVLALSAAISTNTNTDGSAVDMADFELGVMFLMAVTAYTDGDYELVIQESADGSTGWTDVAAASLIGATVTLSAATAGGAVMGKQGAFSTKRYLRARVTSTSVTTGATMHITCVQAGEYLPL